MKQNELENVVRVFLYTINPWNYYRASYGHERRISELERKQSDALCSEDLTERVGRLDELVRKHDAILMDHIKHP